MILPAAALTLLLFAAVLTPVILNTQWAASAEAAPAATTGILGIELMNRYALPFEIAGVLLLVALVGAIIVARDK
jgi:NADH:ubiquinone oxidoreductase subunit 6 (subunit J)